MASNLALFRKFDGRAKLQQLQGNGAATGAHYLRPTFALPPRTSLPTFESAKIRSLHQAKDAQLNDKAAASPAEAPAPPAASALSADPIAPPHRTAAGGKPRASDETGLSKAGNGHDAHLQSGSSVATCAQAGGDGLGAGSTGNVEPNPRQSESDSRRPARPERAAEASAASSTRQDVQDEPARAACKVTDDGRPTATRIGIGGTDAAVRLDACATGEIRSALKDVAEDVPVAADVPSREAFVAEERERSERRSADRAFRGPGKVGSRPRHPFTDSSRGSRGRGSSAGCADGDDRRLGACARLAATRRDTLARSELDPLARDVSSGRRSVCSLFANSGDVADLCAECHAGTPPVFASLERTVDVGKRHSQSRCCAPAAELPGN